MQKGWGWDGHHLAGFRSNENVMEIRAVWLDGRLLSVSELELVLAVGGVDPLRRALLRVLQVPLASMTALLREPARALCAVLHQRSQADRLGTAPHR